MTTVTHETKSPSVWKTLSFSTGLGLANLTGSSIATLLLLYYTAVTGISPWWYALAQTLYAVYNAINDPLVGYLTDKNRPGMLRFGKRFPWIVIGIVGAVVMMQLIYNVPQGFYKNDVVLFFWLLLSLCLFDTFYSIFYVNYMSLSPVTFRTENDRRRLGISNTFASTLMLIFGMILPIVLADKDDPSTFGTFIMISGLLTLVFGAVLLPSVRETPELTKTLVETAEKQKDGNFFGFLWKAVKQKNFMLVVILFLFFNVYTNTAVASMPFFVMNVLGFESEDPMMQMLLTEFAFIFLSLPIWNMVIKRRGFKQTAVIAVTFLCLVSAALMVVPDLLSSTIVFGLLGCAVSGFMALQAPLFNDVLDELSVAIGGHKEGVFTGIQIFFSRFSYVFQGLIVAIVRSLTAFDPTNPETFTPTALFGIRVEMIGVGALLLLVVILLFAKFYNLDQAQMKVIREQLAVIDGQ